MAAVPATGVVQPGGRQPGYSRLLFGRCNRLLRLQNLCIFRLCSSGGLRFGWLGHRFNGSGGSGAPLQQPYCQPPQWEKSPSLLIPTHQEKHHLCSVWLRLQFRHGHRKMFFSISSIRCSDMDNFLKIRYNLCISFWPLPFNLTFKKWGLNEPLWKPLPAPVVLGLLLFSPLAYWHAEPFPRVLTPPQAHCGTTGEQQCVGVLALVALRTLVLIKKI